MSARTASFAVGAGLLLWGMSTGCAVSPRSGWSPDSVRHAVLKAEAGRDAEAEAIGLALGSQSPDLREAGLTALAHIGLPNGVAHARWLVGDKNPAIATWAAFALGRMGGPEAEAALIGALEEEISPVPDQVLLALGRTGTATAATVVARYLAASQSNLRAAAAISIGLFARRRQATAVTDRAIPLLVTLAREPGREQRFAATYALMRIGSPAAGVALIPVLADPDPEVRSNAVRGLGASGAAPQVFDAVLDDPDWRVRVEAARALGSVGSSTRAFAAAVGTRLTVQAGRELARWQRSDALGSGVSTHVLVELLNAALSIGEPGDRARATIEAGEKARLSLPAGAEPDRVRLACALAFAADAREGSVRAVRNCGDASYLAWRRFELETRLWARRGAGGVEPLLALTAHADSRVRAAAADALGQIDGELAGRHLVTLLMADDPYVVSTAAAALTAKLGAGSRPPGIVAALSRALAVLVAEKDPGLVVSVIDAIGALGTAGRELLPRLLPLDADERAAVRRRVAEARAALTQKPVLPSPDPKARVPELLPGGEGSEALVKTTRGELTLRLDSVAPRTVAYFRQLVREGFYRNKTFHRVVPGFVAQGGCPRGDGGGWAGATIGDEVSPHSFIRGAVGIATAGPDTGGGQLFVMHAYHPHLDGGYTLFAQVEEGMDVVDALGPDDRILEIRLRDGLAAKPSL